MKCTIVTAIEAKTSTLPRYRRGGPTRLTGTEFIHMIEGTLEYRHGQTVYVLEPGDTLTFEGEITHGPERLLNKPVRFLSLIIYGGAHP